MFDNDIVHVVEDVDAYVVRCCQIQNVSLVITYTGVVVAALMMAGFLYIALNYGRGRSRYLSSKSVVSRYIYNQSVFHFFKVYLELSIGPGTATVTTLRMTTMMATTTRKGHSITSKVC